MTETITAGAFGTPERIDLAPYRDAIQRAPELLYHLAHLVIPGAYRDGQPTARDLQAAPARVSPLDELEAVYAWLWREAGAWIGHAALDVEPIAHMARRDSDGRVIGCRWIVTDPGGADGLLSDAQALVRILMHAWPTIETVHGDPRVWGQMTARQWVEDVDRSLLLPLARWPLRAREAVPARPRYCDVCGAREVYADVDTASAICRECGRVVHPEVWMLVKDVATILDVAPFTIRTWIDAGLPAKPGRKGRQVELGAARGERDLRAARKALNLRSSANLC